MVSRVLTLAEFSAFYQMDRRTVRKMLAAGQLAGVKTLAGWRIPDVGFELLQRARQQQLPLPDIAYITGIEAAQLVGVTPRWIRLLAERGELPCQIKNGRRLYALRDIDAVARRRTDFDSGQRH